MNLYRARSSLVNFVERLLRPSALLDLANILKFAAISATLLERKIRCQNSQTLSGRSIFSFFRKSQPEDLPKPPPFKGQIRVEREGIEELLNIENFEKITQTAFIPRLDFSDWSTLYNLSKKGEKLQKKEKLAREQIWLGTYYKKEIESLFIPDVAIKWINSSLGWGVFANRDFKKMEYISEYTGKVRKRQKADDKNAYCFEYILAQGHPTRYIIDAREQGGIARYINHSFQPNLLPALATLDGITHVILITNQPIAKGTQLCYDYGPDYWSRRTPPNPL